MQTMNTSILICGAGPAGLTLAHLLSLDEVDVVLIDKLDNTLTEPRAISIDGESLRTLQKAGLLRGVECDILGGLQVDYVSGTGQHLFRAGSPEFCPYGYPTVNAFDQPRLDRYLADSLADRRSVRLRFSHTLTAFTQDDSGVRVQCTDGEGREIEIFADYLVGCDGGRSTVRSLLGIDMIGESNPQPWLVIDTRDPHLADRLDCRFFCDPRRPGMTIRKRNGERRWEWMLMPGEDRQFLLEDDNIREIIAPYTDVSQVEIYRKRVYDFHAIMAEKWRDGRVFLAGDAAHMTPPFAGQGLNSGLRDVSNLSWKLSAVVNGRAHRHILDTYEPERRDHAWELIETALHLGEQIQPIDPQQAAERDAFFAEVNRDPAAVQALQDEIFKSVLCRSVENGLVIGAGPESSAGRLLVQPEVELGGVTALLDDYLGSGFAVVGYDCNPATVLSERLLHQWRNLGASIVQIDPGMRGTTGEGVVDKDNAIGAWLSESGPHIILVRPDRFCMACAAPVAAEACLTGALALLTEPLH